MAFWYYCFDLHLFIMHRKKGSNLICVVSCQVFVFIKDMSVLLLVHLLYCLESCINHQCSVSFWSFVHTEACNKTSVHHAFMMTLQSWLLWTLEVFHQISVHLYELLFIDVFFNLSSVFWKRALSLLSLLIESKGRQYFLFWIWVI